jgi:CBS-domain-containing membrane protein
VKHAWKIDGAAARELPIRAELAPGDDGRCRLGGWVGCPERGPVDPVVCLACPRFRGVLARPRAAQAVLCAEPREGAAERDEAIAWISRPTLAVDLDMTAAELGEMMVEYQSDVLLAVDPHGAAKGLLTQRDVLRAVLDAASPRRAAVQLMRPLPRSIPENTRMVVAARRLGEEPTDAIPLADATGRVTALLTRADVVHWAAERAAADLDA